jgi:hypothetical protein
MNYKEVTQLAIQDVLSGHKATKENRIKNETLKDTIHNNRINDLILNNPGMMRREFNKQLGKSFGRELGEWINDLKIKIFPDVYLINVNKRVIIFIEVAQYHKLNENKLIQYAKYWNAFDCENIELKLFLININETHTTYLEFYLQTILYEQYAYCTKETP